MPALTNSRHERFAQELAKGSSAAQAYIAAGYEPNTGNAATLKGRESVSKRVAEIQAADAEMAQEATQKAAQALAIDREWVLARLVENATRAAAAEDFGPSNKALELIGKEIGGMFVDRSESKHTITHSHEDMLDALERETSEAIAVAH